MLSARIKIFLISLVAILGVGAIVSQWVTVQQPGVELVSHTINAEELTAERLVGQTFTAPFDHLSGIGIMFATYSGRNNTAPIEFHLRSSINSVQDIRTVDIDPKELGDNQIHQLFFDPILDSAGKSFFFYVVSPTGSAGNAVTVDLNTTDPYPQGSAYLVRGPSTLLTQPTALAHGGKQTIDVVFTTYHEVPLRVGVINYAKATGKAIITTFSEQRGVYVLWLKLLVPAVILVGLGWWLATKTRTTQLTSRFVASVLVVLLVMGVLFRLLYAVDLPMTNDEGNYLYDAYALRQGILAGGDGYVKAPLVIGWIALWQFVLGNTILAGRLASIAAAVLMAVPLYFIGRSLGDKRIGLMVAALWLFAGAPTVASIYVHTQALALLFGVTGVALIWTAVRQDRSLVMRFVLGGVLLGLGVASRKSILALGLLPLAILLLESKTFKLRVQRLWYVGVGFVAVLVVLFGFAYLVYGVEGVIEVIGINSAEDGITAVNPDEIDQIRAYSIRGVTPFFREALILFGLGLLGWGVLLEQFLRRVLHKLLSGNSSRGARRWLDNVLPKLGWSLPLLGLWWGWQFFFEYEGEVFHQFGGMTWLWYSIVGWFVILILWPRPQAEMAKIFTDTIVPYSTQPKVTKTAVSGESVSVQQFRDLPIRWRFLSCTVPLLWLFGLYVFYTNWIKFHANYLIEFLVPTVLLAGTGVVLVLARLNNTTGFQVRSEGVHAILRRCLLAAFSLTVIWGLLISSFITVTVPHTGTFNLGALEEAAAWMQQNIPANDSVFTGAAAVPYLAGYRTTLDIAHPRWYAYQFTRENTARLNTFLPPIDVMLDAYRNASWFILDSQTGFSFLMEYTAIEAGLERDWVQVHEIENGSNPLMFYQRIRPATEGRLK